MSPPKTKPQPQNPSHMHVLAPQTMEEPQRKRKVKNNKKRFTDDQIRSLEAIFESESKLEPRKKGELARELGLQPRQVAIWFQNRRARWRSKQIEGEYKVLKAKYDILASQFEFLVKEKQSMLVQLKQLTELSEKHENYGKRYDKSIEVNKIEESSQNREAKLMLEPKRPIFLQETVPTGLSASSRQDHAINKNNTSIGPMMMSTDCSLEKLCHLESSSGGLIDQPPGNLHWWNIWT